MLLPQFGLLNFDDVTTLKGTDYQTQVNMIDAVDYFDSCGANIERTASFSWRPGASSGWPSSPPASFVAISNLQSSAVR